jgi:hypothetical protein
MIGQIARFIEQHQWVSPHNSYNNRGPCCSCGWRACFPEVTTMHGYTVHTAAALVSLLAMAGPGPEPTPQHNDKAGR